MSEQLFSRKEILERFHTSRRVIENYEKLGLVKPTSHNKYGNNLYSNKQVEKIAYIRLYQLLGFSLQQIIEIIDKPKSELEDIVNKQIDKLERQRKNLDMLIDGAKQFLISNQEIENIMYLFSLSEETNQERK